MFIYLKMHIVLKTIANNCPYTVFFSSADIDTAKDISQRLNIPLNEALAFLIDDVAVCRRGYGTTISKRFDYHKLLDKIPENIAGQEEVYDVLTMIAG